MKNFYKAIICVVFLIWGIGFIFLLADLKLKYETYILNSRLADINLRYENLLNADLTKINWPAFVSQFDSQTQNNFKEYVKEPNIKDIYSYTGGLVDKTEQKEIAERMKIVTPNLTDSQKFLMIFFQRHYGNIFELKKRGSLKFVYEDRKIKLKLEGGIPVF